MNWLGLDIGGANLKAALGSGASKSVPFRFWIEQEKFRDVLIELIKSFDESNVDRIAATMTAELADCFSSRQNGVTRIVDDVVAVCRKLGLPDPIFASTNGTFCDPSVAKDQWKKIAAANWYALAKYASRMLPNGTGVVIDMGSTTTDIIAVKQGVPDTIGKTDLDRLRSGELVYAGAGRTPVSSLVSQFQIDGESIPVARELFATVSDAMLLAGFCEEDEQDLNTADGKPFTMSHSQVRLCRMICSDAVEIGNSQCGSLASQVLESLEIAIGNGIESVFDRVIHDHAIVSGSGAVFLKQFLQRKYPEVIVSVMDESVSSSAPAFAVAILAAEAGA